MATQPFVRTADILTKMTLTETDLRQFCGTEQYHKLTLTPLNCTDGVAHVATEGNAFWLVDAIASYQHLHKDKPFQLWELSVNDKKGVLTMKEDTNEPILVEQKFSYTDFPLESIKFYLIDGVLMLPSEH